MLRQFHVVCNSSNRRSYFLLPDRQRDWVWTVSTDSGCHSGCQTAYPPPRESCMRGADHAAVDMSAILGTIAQCFKKSTGTKRYVFTRLGNVAFCALHSFQSSSDNFHLKCFAPSGFRSGRLPHTDKGTRWDSVLDMMVANCWVGGHDV